MRIKRQASVAEMRLHHARLVFGVIIDPQLDCRLS
jgi:hypothetical protein